MQAASAHIDNIKQLIPPDATSEGISEGLIDAKILALADYILPDRIGSRLMAHLLGFAVLSPRTAKQYSLLEEVSDEAILEVKSVAELAKLPGSPCAVESYSKSLLILEALEVIKRTFLGKDKNKRTQIRIRLAAWEISVPKIIARLEALRAEYSNKKVQQIVKKAIKRIKSGEFLAAFGFTARDEQALPSALEPAKQLLQNFARDYGIEAPVAALHQITKMIAAALLPEKYALDGSKKGEFLAGAPMSTAKKGRVSCQKGEFLGDAGEITPEKGVFHGGEGEFHNDLKAKKGEFLARKTPEFEGVVAANSSKSPESGVFHGSTHEKTPDSGANGRISDQKGVFHEPLSVIGNISSKNITLRDTTIIDRAAEETRPATEKGEFSGQAAVYKDPRPQKEINGEAWTYALFFDGRNDPENAEELAKQWFPLWIAITRDFSPHIRRLAAVDTLYHCHYPDMKRGGKPKVLGAWFKKACASFVSTPDEVLPAVATWAATEYDYQQIDEALRAETLQAGHKAPATLSAATDVVPAASQEVDPLLTSSQSRPMRPERSQEAIARRKAYAAKVRRDLLYAGVEGMRMAFVDNEHSRCGCPLYWFEQLHGVDHQRCAVCQPRGTWSQEARDLLRTICQH